MRRLTLLAAVLAALAATPVAAHENGLPPAHEAARQRHLNEARSALSRGAPNAALVPLEVASGMSHEADTEMLQLHMELQRGNFRQAVGFAAHTAAAHRDEPATRELQMWLMAVSGQAEHVRRQLVAGATPDDGLAKLLNALEAAAPLPHQPPAPWPHGVDVPAASRTVATGLLLDGGRLALVPAAAIQATGELWLRNGLGRASRAKPMAVDTTLAELGLAMLSLEPALTPPDTATPVSRAPRPAFAGSPALRVGMLRIDSAKPAWPLLQAGFLGRVDREGRQALGWQRGATVGGGPVFDAAGRLVGLALPGADGQERLLPITQLGPLQSLPLAAEARPRTPDEIYEAALPWVAQVLSSTAP